MIGKLDRLNKKKEPMRKVLLKRADRHNDKFDKMTSRVERNLERNEGIRAYMAEDQDMINIVSTYRI